MLEIHELAGGAVVTHPTCVLRGDIRANGSRITVNKGTTFNRKCILRAAEGADITIGEDCLLSSVEIYTSDLHSVIDIETGKRVNPAKDVVICDRVWIASNVIILPGVTIGSGSIIGAGSVVTSDIPENCLAVGNPAKPVKTGVSWVRERI